MKKILVFILTVCVLMLPFAASATQEIEVTAKAAALIDAASGKVLYESNGNEHLPIASVTKIMTLNLIFDAVENGTLSLDEKINVSQTAAGMGGSQAFIDAGYEYTASDLIKSIIIASANDAAVAMAERLAGSQETFVVKMNKKAAELNMNDTCFKNCTGLPAQGHYSSALDVAKMSKELLTHDDYFKWSTVWMDELKHAKDGRVTQLVNTNKLIRSLSGCDGLKTGSTNEAKFCVATTAKRGDMRLISVILGGDTSQERFQEAAKLINYGFANFENKIIFAPGQQVCSAKIGKCKDEQIGLNAQTGYSVCIENDGSKEIRTDIEVNENICAPVQAGTVLGKAHIFLDGQEIGCINLVADRDYKQASFWERLKDIVAFWK